MKKSIKAFLISLSCVCMAAATGCALGTIHTQPPKVEDSSNSSASTPEKPQGTLKVTFAEEEGYDILSNVKNGELVNAGDVVSFRLDMSVFYTGYPIVYVNGKAIAPNDNGEYSVEMSEAIEVTVGGIYKDTSNMAGTGSFEDAFVVSRPIDLLYIAEQVNKGVYEYVTGAYVLANDIDCGGEELEIIGDMSTENSFFSGCFTCYTNADTGEMEEHTISNFVINSENANHVGLFGTVYSDLSVTSSGLFYGINLENFIINASLDEDMLIASRSLSVGSLIGYGVGANVYLCNATNGEINVYGDASYFSFAGGLVGYQQAFYMAEYDSYFPSEIVYSSTDVDIRIMKGMALYAGGISGYLATNSPSGATAFIHNSYARGNVSGALRAGGVAGGLGRYTSVGNSYASGNVFAKATQSLDDILLTDTEYCYANAGGVVGFAENDTIVNDCFFAGQTAASAVSAGCASAKDIIGGGYEEGNASAAAEAYVINNCIPASELKETMSDNNNTFKATFGWENFDWVFSASDYPTVNYNSAETAVKASVTFHYVSNNGEVTVNGNPAETITYFDTANQSANIYAPMGNYFLTESFRRTILADNGYVSYGYFFDEACTQKVPYSYVPQRNVNLYVGFADVTPILGTYQMLNENSTAPLTVTFDSLGFAHYSDGTTEQTAYYFFDGETIIIEGARLARYYDGEIIIDETDTSVAADANFDLYRYNYYDFVGGLTDEELQLYDGVYFTAENPLRAKKNLFRGERYDEDGKVYKFYGETVTIEHGSDFLIYTYVISGNDITLTDASGNTSVLGVDSLKEFDQFKGVWTKSATINKTYIFDGMGGWTYEYVSYDRANGYSYEERLVEQASGTYTVSGDILYLSDGTVVTFEDGNLLVSKDGNKQTYYAEFSYVGTWQNANLTVQLLGIGKNGVGNAVLDYGDGMYYDLVYEVSETNGYVCLYWPHDIYGKDALFGYFVYDAATNTLLATLTDSDNAETGYTQGNLFVVDDYNGEWICDVAEFSNVEFDFNGNGLYGFLYGYAGMEGKLTLLDLTTNKETLLTYTLDSTLKGHFAYNGVRYVMEYDEDREAVILSAEGVNAQLQRKDELAKIKFVDTDGNTYYFDGRSNLTTTGGKLTVNGETTYTYLTNDNGWLVKDGEEAVGEVTLAESKAHYLLTYTDGTVKNLYVSNNFIGEWAIGGEYGMLKIGPTDLNGLIQANYKGHDVIINTLEPTLLTFKYREDNMPITYYIFVVEDTVLGYDVLVLSQYTNLYSGDYAICTKAHALYGEWEWAKSNGDKFILKFDGIASGAYSYGVATLSRGGAGKTDYYYRTEEKGITLWSQAPLGGKTLYYKIELLDIATDDLTADNVFVKRDAEGNIIAAFKRIEADGLLFVEAKDEANNVFFFDGGNAGGASGKLYVNGEYKYDYVVKAYNTDQTADLEITDVETGVKYSATLDYSTSGNYSIEIGEVIEDNA